MTVKRIYELAIRAQTDLWYIEKKRLDEHPESELCKVREANAWKELQEVEQMFWQLPELQDSEVNPCVV